MTWQDQYLNRFYRSKTNWIDGTGEFYNMCRKFIPPGGKILEIGSGPSNDTSRFLATLGELHGIDIDSEISQNDALITAHCIKDKNFPFNDSTFDACVSNYVLEHVEDIDSHLKEVQRVLKPQGVYLFRTPNCWHYVTLIARITPHCFHVLVANRLRNLPTAAHDPYPTYYRFNSRRVVLRKCNKVGLIPEEIHMVEKEPCYGFCSRVLFILFMGYERLVNAFEFLSEFRSNLFGVLRKSENLREINV